MSTDHPVPTDPRRPAAHEQLAYAIGRLGPAVLQDPSRCRGVLADLGLDPREVAALSAAVADGAPGELQRMRPG